MIAASNVRVWPGMVSAASYEGREPIPCEDMYLWYIWDLYPEPRMVARNLLYGDGRTAFRDIAEYSAWVVSAGSLESRVQMWKTT